MTLNVSTPPGMVHNSRNYHRDRVIEPEILSNSFIRAACNSGLRSGRVLCNCKLMVKDTDASFRVIESRIDNVDYRY